MFKSIIAIAFAVQAQESNTCILGTQTGCSTGVALGLSLQIADKMTQMGHPFSALDSTWIHCSTPCVSRLQSSAASSLVAAAKSKNDYMTLNSAWRSAAQQYLLYEWGAKGICGINLVATPGTSNHEGGEAVDVDSYSYWMTALNSHGFAHSYPSSDPVHFDHSSSANLA